MIRPLLLATEERGHLRRQARGGLPIVKSRCPADGVTVRQETKQFVHEASRRDPAFRQKTPARAAAERHRRLAPRCIPAARRSGANERSLCWKKHCWGGDRPGRPCGITLPSSAGRWAGRSGAVVKADAYGHGDAVVGPPCCSRRAPRPSAVSCPGRSQTAAPPRRHGAGADPGVRRPGPGPPRWRGRTSPPPAFPPSTPPPCPGRRSGRACGSRSTLR